MAQETIKPYRPFSLSAGGPGSRYTVWLRFYAPDGTSRSRIAARSEDLEHAHRIVDALNTHCDQPRSNWPAVVAALSARGPRCQICGAWTFRPQYLTLPVSLTRACPDCLPVRAFKAQAGWL